MKKLVFGLLPVVLIVVLVVLFLSFWSSDSVAETPPVEILKLERITLNPDLIELRMRNDGPDPVEIAQVLVNGAYWQFELEPEGAVRRLQKKVVRIEYPWIEGDDQHITLVTSTGVTIDVEIPAAVASPDSRWRFAGTLALLGLLIGVVPVFIGLLWFPFIRSLKSEWYGFFLALTVGLLVFLGVDAVEEALEAVHDAPESLSGIGVLLIGFFLSFLFLFYLSRGRKKVKGSDEGTWRNRLLAFNVAFGIGIHNFGEGLAVGSAFALGNVALGALLVVGFMIHNVTEGIPIVAPLAKLKTRLSYLILLGLLAGAPAIVGAWIGGFAYSAIWAVFFLGIGAGAVFQVAIEIGINLAKEGATRVFSLHSVSGFSLGLVLMYGTGILIVV